MMEPAREVVPWPETVMGGRNDMPAKKKATKRAAPKPKSRAVARARRAAKPAIECEVCGYRLVVDEACGCADEHVLICCGQPMVRR